MKSVENPARSEHLLGGRDGMHVVTLGTAAGPSLRSSERGIATAVVVNGSWYLVDFGLGCTRAAGESGLAGSALRAAFVTHMHSDHVVEIPTFLLWNWGSAVDGMSQPVPLIGPSDALTTDGMKSGTGKLLEHSLKAFEYDAHIREVDEGRPRLAGLFEARDIDQDATHPVEVYRDENVTVSAVWVEHPPVEPAFAFRFDSAYGSVTTSGDTAECDALVDLARDSDLLIHEAVNLEFFQNGGFSPEFLRHQEISHTPPVGAGRVATRAGVRSLLLSHLAGPAPESYWLSEAQKTFSGPVRVATSGGVYTVGPSTRSSSGDPGSPSRESALQ